MRFVVAFSDYSISIVTLGWCELSLECACCASATELWRTC